jgi:hypothetical protein
VPVPESGRRTLLIFQGAPLHDWLSAYLVTTYPGAACLGGTTRGIIYPSSGPTEANSCRFWTAWTSS